VSIVIPSYGDIKFLKPLLKSIFKTCKDFEYEVIISDDFCQELNSQELRKLVSEHVHVVFHTQRTGFAGAVNRGLAVAKWDVVLLNSDMIALPGWLNNLQFAAYEIDPKIGLVSPQLLYPSGRIQYGGTFQVTVSAPQWFGHLDQGRFANFPSANEGKYIRAISGAAVYIKKTVLEDIGLFDDNYWLGFEDVDFGFKARQKGYRCYLEPNSKLIHLESATRGKVQGPREYASMRRFWAKWKESLSPQNEPKLIHLLISEEAKAVTKLFANNLNSHFIDSKINCHLHLISVDTRLDEKVISYIQNEHENAHVVALDTRSVETAWLATEQAGTPYFYILGQDEADLDVKNPKHRSLLKPEFGFIPSNRSVSELLQSVMPWEVSKPVASLPATFLVEHRDILLIDPPYNFEEAVVDEIQDSSVRVNSSTWDDFISNIEESLKTFTPAIIICFKELGTSFIPLSLMASGIVVITVASDALKYEVLDGYNSFTFRSNQPLESLKFASNLISNKESLEELATNGKRTAQEMTEKFNQDFMFALNTSKQYLLPEHKVHD
jgi:GT2 family glycosyltransferase